MRPFERLRHTVSVKIVSLLDQVENQEAVANATLREIERGATRVRVHRKRCERRVAQLESRIEELDKTKESWRERARRLREDRDKALECVRRYQAAEHSRTATLAQLDSERQLLSKIQEDEHAIALKLDAMRRRCAALSSRDARTAGEVGGAGVEDMEAVFDRWEARIEEREAVCGSSVSGPDSFERVFLRDESEAELERTLERILADEEVSS